MISIQQFDNIFIYRPFVDFRKEVNGLTAIVQDQMQLSPFDNYLFIFCNRNRDRLKILYWDKTGFAMWYKLLQENRYKWPTHLEEDSIVVDLKKLKKFLKGMNPWQIPHSELHYKIN